MIATSTVTSYASSEQEDADYVALHTHLKFAPKEDQLFTTDAKGLWDAYLIGLPADRRAHYNCRTCKRFIETYGGLVRISESGSIYSPFWEKYWNGMFGKSVELMNEIVRKAKVTGVFYSDTDELGTEFTRSDKAAEGGWFHLHSLLPAAFKHPTLTARQFSAEKSEDFKTLCRGLADYPVGTVKHAHALLTNGGLYRSEKHIGVAKWLLDLHEARDAVKGRDARLNVTWRAVASAPAGFCHIRTTMISTLLDDILIGKPFEAIKASFDRKMAPTAYQRPTAAPTSGQLAAAERLVEKMASAGSLARRYAKLEDVIQYALWQTAPYEEPKADGVFGHLRKPGIESPIRAGSQTVTWTKFAKKVMPFAETIEFLAPVGPAAFFGFVTASDPNSPPILQWDIEGHRNPVSWYVYSHGSNAKAWNLEPGAWIQVNAITGGPPSWTTSMTYHGDRVCLILDGARDLHPDQAGLGLFPEILKSEYHGIRSAMEAYSNSKVLSGANEATACGILVQGNSPAKITLRVKSGGILATYVIDRFE